MEQLVLTLSMRTHVPASRVILDHNAIHVSIWDCQTTAIVYNIKLKRSRDATKPHYVYAIDCSYLSKCEIVLVDINKCIISPCENAAICIEAFNSYACACIAGYTGTHCQTSETVGLSNTNRETIQCNVV